MSGLDPVGRREVRDIILDLRKQGRTVFFSTHILSDAEMICDRVAVLVNGKLQGIGAPAQFVPIEVQTMEIFFELPEGRTLPATLDHRATQTGARYRIEIPEAELYSSLDRLREASAEILSVTPVRPTLEDYFLRLVGREGAASSPAEVLTP